MRKAPPEFPGSNSSSSAFSRLRPSYSHLREGQRGTLGSGDGPRLYSTPPSSLDLRVPIVHGLQGLPALSWSWLQRPQRTPSWGQPQIFLPRDFISKRLRVGAGGAITDSLLSPPSLSNTPMLGTYLSKPLPFQ